MNRQSSHQTRRPNTVAYTAVVCALFMIYTHTWGDDVVHIGIGTDDTSAYNT